MKIGAIISMNDNTLEGAARLLEASGQYRILRKLVRRETTPWALGQLQNVGVIVDAETTGLDQKRDEVIEIGAVAFTYDDAGRIGDVVGTYSGLQQPSAPIPSAITKLTGITNEMVEGKAIDIAALNELVEPADLVIAHNARFDRPFCERLSTSFVPKPWACSVAEINWSDRGLEGSKLGYLVNQAGLFHDGHRAIDDCYALLEVLARSAREASPFAELLRSSAQARIRIYAANSPFDLKDVLKVRGYRWNDGGDGRPKAWWIEVDEDLRDVEIHYLRTDIYGWDADPLTIRLTALDRFRA
ncbi:3'-5' exonuclease [Bradyrhizobium elkanii]|uniref:3'-5' exonuclease n=2 Tax=Bradyrhizobium elkanii TaxID=29448 RepID=UPI0035151989